jgi:uncharacterized protein (TIGR00297 family)
VTYSRLIVGVTLATAIALLAHRARALTAGGAVAAIVTGTLAVAAGWSWAIVLIAYFVSSTLLSRYRATEKDVRAGGLVEKHGARDAMQVVANGGAFTAMALGEVVRPNTTWQMLAAGALAAAAADTWATEIGVLAREQPRSILRWRPVPVGTSGGVTAQGLLAGIAGAVFIALVVTLAGWPRSAVAGAVAGGILGCLLDSVIGASFQSRRWCASCAAPTEQRIHRCGTETTRTGGISWLENDAVNAIATLGGALLGAIASTYLTHDR